MMPKTMHAQVALVTGASRGVGKGVALGLAHAGGTIYATGRTITNLGPGIISLPCDHTDDKAVNAVFDRIHAEHGRLDVLVNCAWGGYERMVEDGRFTWPAPFWEQPLWRWEAMFAAGVRAAFVASQHAARLMVPTRRGLIVNVSHWAAQKYIGNVLYGTAKAATDKLTADMAHELRPYGVTVVSLYPGLVRTEAVLAAGVFDLSNSESPEFIGRAVAALATDPAVSRWAAHVVVAAALAREYGFTDVDGTRPKPLTFEQVSNWVDSSVREHRFALSIAQCLDCIVWMEGSSDGPAVDISTPFDVLHRPAPGRKIVRLEARWSEERHVDPWEAPWTGWIR